MQSPVTISISEIRSSSAGLVMGPNDPGYDRARIAHNGAVDRRTAWAQAGLTAGDYTTATGVHGLATGGTPARWGSAGSRSGEESASWFASMA